MEVRLSSHCRVLYNQNLKLLLSAVAHTSLQSLSKTSFKKHIRDLTLKWRIQLEEISQCPLSTQSTFTHVVKEGETLTSISKLYGRSMYSIAAANKNILDVNLVFVRQHLNIPTSAAGGAPMLSTLKKGLPYFHYQERMQSLRNVLEGFSSEKIYTMLTTTHHLPHAKTTGYFLVLVPLIAFCIRCIISAVHTQVVKKTGSKGHYASETKGQRWKSALSDIRDPDNIQPVSGPSTANVEDDEEQVSSKELSLAYKRLEDDYEKFLSQCGMSRWGQWRGGSPG